MIGLVLNILSLLLISELKMNKLGMITILSNSTLNENLAMAISQTIKEFFHNSSIDVIIEPNMIDTDSTTFDVYPTSSEVFDPASISKFSDKLQENGGIKDIVAERFNIGIDAIWMLNDTSTNAYSINSRQMRNNFIVLLVILAIIFAVLVMNIVKYLLSEKRITQIVESNNREKPKEKEYKFIKTYRLEKTSRKKASPEYKTSLNIFIEDLDYPKRIFISPIQKEYILTRLNQLFALDERETFNYVKRNNKLFVCTTPEGKNDIISTAISHKTVYNFMRINENLTQQLFNSILNRENPLILSFVDSASDTEMLYNLNELGEMTLEIVDSRKYNEKIFVCQKMRFHFEENQPEPLTIVQTTINPFDNHGIILYDILMLRWIIRSINKGPLIILFKNEDQLKEIAPFIYYDSYMQDLLKMMKPKNKRLLEMDFETIVGYIGADVKEFLDDTIQLSVSKAFILNEINFLLKLGKTV